MKMRNKGKVYPSPSSSSSAMAMPSYSSNRDALSFLKLLPAVVLALASVLSLEDREVLAYMITRSLKYSSNPSSIGDEKKKKSNRKPSAHKPPVFDCGCFDCYTSYWFRWDSSPNRELIHQAIEAYEEHLATGETQSKKNGRGGKKREKIGRRSGDKPVDAAEIPAIEAEIVLPEVSDGSPVEVALNDEPTTVLPEKEEEEEEAAVGNEDQNADEDGGIISPEEEEDELTSPEKAVVLQSSAPINHKGFARKVLPDVLGLFNSRLWNLWSPNV